MHWEKLLEKPYCYYEKLFIMNGLGKVECIFFSSTVIQWTDTVIEWNKKRCNLWYKSARIYNM